MKTTLCTAFAIVTLGLFSGSAQAASDFHIDDLAAQLERETAELLHEIEHHFRATPSYRHLAADAREMQQLARHIHEVAHYTNARRHIAVDVKKLDRLYHHVEGLVDDMDRRAGYRNECAYHHGDAYTLGRAEFHHLRAVMSRISATLHHLQADLQPVRNRVRYEYRPRPIRNYFPPAPRPFLSINF